MKPIHRFLVVFILLLSVTWAVWSQNDGSAPYSPRTTPLNTQFIGSVNASYAQNETTTDRPISGATVYLVPVDAIDLTPITGMSIDNHEADAHDEPLEDTIRAHKDSIPSAITDSGGHFVFGEVPDGKYFVHVGPDSNEDSYLPGGDQCRTAYMAEELRGRNMRIRVSTPPPPDATFIGSTRCLSCHDTELHPDWHPKQTGHRLAWSVPGKWADGQDSSRFPNWLDSMTDANWPDTTDYKNGKLLELGDYNYDSGGSARFKLRAAGDPRVPINVHYANVYLWRSGNQYTITLENAGNSSDPNSPLHLPVELIYGGGVHRQRFIVKVSDTFPDRPGLYTVLQYNPDGEDRRRNKDRRVWRDYKFHLWWETNGTEDPSDDRIKAPGINKNTIQAECAGCHVTGAFKRDIDSSTGFVSVTGVRDPEGAYDLNGDGWLEEVNIGCESCHGPGSTHAENVLQTWPVPQASINPRLLSAERSDVLCGRCHDRRRGVPDFSATQAVNASEEFLLPGANRNTLVSEYSHSDGPGPKPGKDLWEDGIHSKSPRQQYSEHIKSTHYKNDRILVACMDCHHSHGESPYPTWLRGDPADPDSSLCASCHELTIADHLVDYGHTPFIGTDANCIDCHMPGTSHPGGDAGKYGLFINPPATDDPTDRNGRPIFKDAKTESWNVYWEGNLNSHVFDVPTKSNVGVWGKLPNDAMPIPYTSECAVCHDASAIPFR